MKSKTKKTFGAVVLLIIAMVLGYYLVHRENKKVAGPSEKKSPDSATHVTPEKTPIELGAKPEVNPKDGSVKIVEEFIKVNAKNPATFEFLEWSEVSTEGDYWKVRCKYRGVASFDKEVTTNAWFYIQNNKVAYTKIISKI
ncbi:MAG TPA: hypothetical protein VGQ59_02030 [Cyclobacteriaceae bacterium]|jgi:hypothetical protein|nr:hypothetical protein [Cyclobacteriaceae bacterium]